MTPSFEDFKDEIRSLPPIPNRSDVLNDRFLIAREGRLEAFYAPLHGVSANAMVVIVGLTPGMSQTVLAFQAARTLLSEGHRGPRLFSEIRRRIAFAGTMRSNLIHMLDKIGLADRLRLTTTEVLFAEASDWLHATSALRYPVLKDRRNYSGSPRLINSRLLGDMAKANLPSELEALPDALIVPLGRAVEEALVHIGLAESRRVLWGFPHPSGANGHRLRQFKAECRSLRRAVRAW